ncbi:MAG: putative type II secretion system protein D [Chlamydiae bacterium]|nr:putative type II secretion system protein D [Chlamydiota bacterium]
MKKIITCLALVFASLSLEAQTIAEKKESFHKKDSEMDKETLSELHQVNEQLEEKRFALQQLYDQAFNLYKTKAEKSRYEALLLAIRQVKAEIAESQRMWRGEMRDLVASEEYALWHQPETTLQQLVMDYGAPDYIYLIPPEVGGMRMSLQSSLPIPRESWGECLELILSQYGIGIRELNPYLHELYILHKDASGIKGILDEMEKLDLFSSQARVCYVLTPSQTDPRGDLLFLQKFSNPAQTKIELVGGKIFLTATVENIQELLKLYSFSKRGNGSQDFQLVTLAKMEAGEMERILNSAFHDGKISNEGSTLRVIPLQSMAHSLFLYGSKEEVKKATDLIRNIESQVEDPQEKTVFWYTTKHSDAEELAGVLARVYDLLVEGEASFAEASEKGKKKEKGDSNMIIPPTNIRPIGEKKGGHKTADGQNNFIVDPKTGAIIMVVEQEALPKIKDLLKKLDVPKKMVQIEVLLFEKKISNQNKFGLNLFNLGSQAAQKSTTGLGWSAGGPGGGILDFLISRNKGSGIPAYDLAYQFLLGLEDVQINASPSVTTINQTPATIAIVEEISIDAGADEKKNTIYNRAQYGITMEITPTINLDEEGLTEEGEAFITLDTDITFDTTKSSADSRPDVTRRHIQNHVRIADGQTVILGGLRRKNTSDNKESLPFLGEIPGIGKLFSHTEMNDSSTEMFVFITPKIIPDPVEDAEKFRREELKKRPGDIPEFLHELVEAEKHRKQRLFEGSLTALFGRKAESEIVTRKRRGEYDGK